MYLRLETAIRSVFHIGSCLVAAVLAGLINDEYCCHTGKYMVAHVLVGAIVMVSPYLRGSKKMWVIYVSPMCQLSLFCGSVLIYQKLYINDAWHRYVEIICYYAWVLTAIELVILVNEVIRLKRDQKILECRRIVNRSRSINMVMIHNLKEPDERVKKLRHFRVLTGSQNIDEDKLYDVSID